MWLRVSSHSYPKELTESVYNSLDCCITYDLFGELSKQVKAGSAEAKIYDFQIALQRVALYIMLRGVRVDRPLMVQKLLGFEVELKPLTEQFHEICEALFERNFNPSSPLQMIDLFYTRLGLPPSNNIKTGKPTTDNKAMEKLVLRGGLPAFLASYIIALRTTRKIISTLKSGTSADGRLRESINITGTETGRWSSSKPSYGTGGMSGQNITERLRDIFIADKGQIFLCLDLDQAESRVVGLCCYRDTGSAAYLDACESGDIHTKVCVMAWPERKWSLDMAENRNLAETTPASQQFSLRDVAKRVGHGTNYVGTPQGISYEVKIPQTLVADFQHRYFAAFPEIKVWHERVASRLQATKSLTTMLGRKRCFFKRVWERNTIKEAVAYEPQSVVGQITNLALLELQRSPNLECLKNTHDGVLLQTPQSKLEASILEAEKAFAVKLEVPRRTLTIPVETMVGWNWGKASETNPNGLKVWRGKLNRTEQATLKVEDLVLW